MEKDNTHDGDGNKEKSQKIRKKNKAKAKKRGNVMTKNQEASASLDDDGSGQIFQELEFSWAGVPELALDYDLCATGPALELALRKGDDCADIGRLVDAQG